MSDNELIRRGDAKQCCTDELRNTMQLLSNPPQSSAAWDARNAIDAIPAVQPTVKPLVWAQISIPKRAMQGIWWRAKAMTGNYEVHQFDGRDEIIVTLRGLGLGNPEYPTIEAAKAAAQADYEARILSVLDMQPTVSPKQLAAQPDDVAALVEALRSTLNFIENTEGEMGVILGCGDKARAVLARVKGVM